MTDDKLVQVERALESLRPVPPVNEIRRAGTRRAYLQKAAVLRKTLPRNRAAAGRFRRVAIVVAVLGAGLLATTGVARAADNAVPGDLLYGVDITVEKARQRITTNPHRAAALGLSIASERLTEAEQLVASGDAEHLGQALNGYRDAIQSVGRSGIAGDKGELSAQIEATLIEHEERLAAIQLHTPEAAWPGLERAMQAAQKGRQRALEAIQNSGRPDDAGPPEDVPGRDAGHGEGEDGNIDGQSHEPSRPSGTPGGRPEDTGPPEDHGQGQKGNNSGGQER